MWAMYLHLSGGLTLPRLKEVCVDSRVLSAGRARAVLLFLRYLRLIEPQAKRARGEAVRYVPTAAFVEAWRLYLRSGLEAACLIEPATRIVLDRLDEPVVFETFGRIIGEGYLVASRSVDHTRYAFADVFLHKHAGMQIVHWLLLSAPADGPFPPRTAVLPATAALARNLRVSRAHVSRVLDDAERTGLLRRAEHNVVLLEKPWRTAVAWVVSTQLLALLISAARTARENRKLLFDPALSGLRSTIVAPPAQIPGAAEQPPAPSI
jgi:hypothetical protein